MYGVFEVARDLKILFLKFKLSEKRVPQRVKVNSDVIRLI